MLENRRYIIQAVFILVGVIFLIKLFTLQVVDDTYQIKAERNIVQRVVEYPFRGLIYDRSGDLIVYNEPIYDLMVVPRDVYIEDTTQFCTLFNIDKATFEANMKKSRKYSAVKPSIFLKKIAHSEYASIQDKLFQFKGFYVNPRTIRRYNNNLLANTIGYTGEVSPKQLEKDTSNYYKAGDYVGITGLEKSYENDMRGARGISQRLVNVNGIEKGSYLNGAYDTASVPGKNLHTTIDLELQAYAEQLLKGKRGSIVAIEPKSGEILVMASAPSYDPNLLTGRDFGKNFEVIKNETISHCSTELYRLLTLRAPFLKRYKHSLLWMKELSAQKNKYF